MTDRGPEYEVQSAVYQRLKAVPDLVAVFDYVPADGTAIAPFAAIGVITSEEQTSRCGATWIVSFRVHLFSKQAGREEVWTRLHAIRQALRRQSLPLANGYRMGTALRSTRAGDQNDRLIKLAHAYIDFTCTVSNP